MRRSFLLRFVVLALVGFGLLAVIARVVVERGKRTQASASEAPPGAEATEVPDRPSVGAETHVPQPPARSVPQPRADPSSAAKPSKPAPEPPMPTPQPPSVDEVMEELGTVHREIARLQFEIVMLESKGRAEEAQAQRATLGDLEKRAATLREKAGLPSRETNPAHGPVVPR
jgi:type IV secretory pathway VirB10-like protein